MRYLLLVCLLLSTTYMTSIGAEDTTSEATVEDVQITTAEPTTPEKDAAIERYLELTHAEKAFVIGVKAGMEIGFDPKNNPGLAMVPKDKLAKTAIAVEALVEEKFSFDRLKSHMKDVIADKFTLEQLTVINKELANPIIQEYLQKNIEMVPFMTELGAKAMQPLQGDIMQVVQQIMREP